MKKHAGQMVKKKYFLTYIDILGFEERAEKEAEKSNFFTPELVRAAYRREVERRLDELKGKRTIHTYTRKEDKTVVHFREMSLDSWLLFSDSIWKAFRSVGEVLKTNLPFEVAIGVKEFDELPVGEELIFLRNETMVYLKTNILSPYKKWYSKEYGKSVEQTFILLTSEAYKELESKKIKKIARKPYKSFDFYLVEQKEFEKKLEVLEFLERVRIGSERIEYREIEELYVKPENYEEIERILKDNNIVFIIGDAEMGKTYTAIKLLFEFFKEGYEPVHISEERRREQWEFVRHKQEFEGKAVYLEDPWGKVEFERVESLFRDVGNLIAEAKRKRCKVIVTSREKVFKEFEKKKETAEDLWKYVSELKVNLAYSKEDLIEMLRRYIEVFVPSWSDNKKLRENAFEAVGEKLITPMSIKQLIDYTQDAKNEDSLNAGMEKAAEETKIVFAREIKEMFNRGEYDKLVFLSFPYIKVDFDYFEIAKSCYSEVLKDLKYLGYDLIKAKNFDDLLEETNEVERWFYLRYVHPSYWDAFEYALMDDDKPNNICKKIFSKVLLKLAEKYEVGWVAEAIAKNFNRLPEDVRNLLFTLAERDKTAGYVAYAVAENFNELPEGIRNLLFKLAEKDEIADDVAYAIADNFNELPEDARNLLFKLAENGESEGALWVATSTIIWNFNRVSEDVRNLLFRLVEEDCDAACAAVLNIVGNFKNLPENVRALLFKLAEKDENALYIAEAIADNFDELPEDVRNLLNMLQDELQQVIVHWSRHEWSKIKAMELISTAKSKIDKNFALRVLDKLRLDENERVRIKAEDLMKSIRDD